MDNWLNFENVQYVLFGICDLFFSIHLSADKIFLNHTKHMKWWKHRNKCKKKQFYFSMEKNGPQKQQS